MTTVHLFVGIDVCKRWLDAFAEPLGYRRFANSPEGVDELAAWIGGSEASVGLEATGPHHVLAAERLAEAGCSVHVYNPRRVKQLAGGLGFLAKTDRVDARVVACCVAIVQSPFEARSEAGKRLRDLSRHIDHLTRTRADLKKKKGEPGQSDLVAESIRRQLDALDAEIALLEAAWRELVETSPLHAERYRNLLTVPRIGPKSARAVASELPEDLSRYSRKQLAAYFGLVPCDDQSGDSRRRSRLKCGNPHLRRPLFMAATLASYFDPECKAFADRLRAKGKHHLCVVCAVMHKLARRAIAVVLRNGPWRENMPHPLDKP